MVCPLRKVRRQSHDILSITILQLNNLEKIVYYFYFLMPLYARVLSRDLTAMLDQLKSKQSCLRKLVFFLMRLLIIHTNFCRISFDERSLKSQGYGEQFRSYVVEIVTEVSVILLLARDSTSCSSLSNFRQFLIPIEGILQPILEKLYRYIDLPVIVE